MIKREMIGFVQHPIEIHSQAASLSRCSPLQSRADMDKIKIGITFGRLFLSNTLSAIVGHFRIDNQLLTQSYS